MQNNVLARMLVIPLLGDDTVIEAFSQYEVETHEGAGRMIMRELRRQGDNMHRLPIDLFFEEACRQFDRGIRLLFVCGYPKTLDEAEDLAASCPHTATFSFEHRGASQSGQLRAFLLRRTRFTTIDTSRNTGQQHTYLRNRINSILVELEIQAKAQDAVMPNLSPAIA